MQDRELVEALAQATQVVMDRTGLPFSEALVRARVGLKEYIRLRVETMRDLVAEGYSEEAAFTEAKRLVGLGLSMGSI